MRRPGQLRTTGFTLVELMVVLCLAALLAAVAWPSFQAQLQRSRRADAVAALTRLQIAQEQHRAHHGLYATQLAALGGAGVPRSAEGWYQIELLDAGGDRYEARARALAGSPAAADADCPLLSLQVREGMAAHAPSARCWNR
jgi:type IV pilus assembly protein PilE